MQSKKEKLLLDPGKELISMTCELIYELISLIHKEQAYTKK